MDEIKSSIAGTQHNLRHLRVFLAVVDTKSVTRAAEVAHLSQPAVTQALAKIEREFGASLFSRTTQGLFANPQGQLLATRARRAFGYLDPALDEISPRLRTIITTSQLRALIAVRECENYTLAAKSLDIAQPTVHRAVKQLEQEAGRTLFERTPFGIVASKAAGAVAQAARLAFLELAQAEADLAEARAEEAGMIVIGAMPLARSFVLPRAIAEFRSDRPNTPIHILEGSYADLLAGLRRGEIDFLIGALRDPAPIEDVEQHHLFTDTLVLVSGTDHTLASRQSVTAEELASYPWVVARRGTPIRTHFEALFERSSRRPTNVIESSSLILMRELLSRSEHLGCISLLQAQAELSRGLLKALAFDTDATARPIGLTMRQDWLPTAAQRQFLTIVSSVVASVEKTAR